MFDKTSGEVLGQTWFILSPGSLSKNFRLEHEEADFGCVGNVALHVNCKEAEGHISLKKEKFGLNEFGSDFSREV